MLLEVHFNFEGNSRPLSEVEWGLHEETKVYLRSSRYGALEGLR